MPVRIPLVVVVLAVGLTVGVVVTGVWPRTTPAPASQPHLAPGTERPAAPQERSAMAVLHAWDERRATAWAMGDAAGLSRLYTPGASAGAADAALLRRYVGRGLVVRGMRMQVLRARVLTVRARLIELEVTDRLSSAVAVRADDARAARRLPVDSASTRRLVLRRAGGQWVMARVTAEPGAGCLPAPCEP